MTGAERKALKLRVDAARRARVKREIALERRATYTPSVTTPDGETRRIDVRPMCAATVGAWSLRNTGSPCPYHAAPGSHYCGVHARQHREEAAA
jgi:hypothetical protein